MPARKRGEGLRELVARLLDEHEMSGRQFAKLAADRGFSVSYTTINSLKNGTRDPAHVTDDTLLAIAEVFNLDENQVRQAAGIAPRDDTTDPQLLALHKTLTPDEKQAALRMYQAYVRSLRNLRGEGTRPRH